MLRGRGAGIAGWTPGLAFPNASTTGCAPVGSLVEVGTGFVTTSAGAGAPNTGWAWSSTFVSVTTNGAILSGLYIPSGGVNVSTGVTGVTIQNCLIQTTGQGGFGVKLNGAATGASILNCTIAGTNNDSERMSGCVKDVSGIAAGCVIDRCHFFWAENGYNGAQAVITNNYMHSIGNAPGDHLEWINCEGPSLSLLLVQGNTLINEQSQTAACYIASSAVGGNGTNVPRNVTVTGNLLVGGDYAVYGGSTGTVNNRTDTGCTISGTTLTDAALVTTDNGATVTGTNIVSTPPTTVSVVTNGTGTLSQAGTSGSSLSVTLHYTSNIVITDNYFSTMIYPTCGQFGTHTAYDPAPATNVWSGNQWYDGPSAGTLIPA